MPSPESSARVSKEQASVSSQGAAPSSFTDEFQEHVNADLGTRRRMMDGVSPDTFLPGTETEPSYASESVLTRGLQVPAKSKYASSGFAYPDVLETANVSREQWANFTKEISKYANLSPSQWLTTIGYGAGAFAVGAFCVGFFSAIPAAVVGHKLRKNKENENFIAAANSSEMIRHLQRWNESYFNPRGLAVRIDLPGHYTADMQSMDVSTSEAYKTRNLSSPSSSNSSRNPSFDSASEQARKKETKTRMRAGERGRLVIIPLSETQHGTTFGIDQDPAPAYSGDADIDPDTKVTMFTHIQERRPSDTSDMH